MRCLFCKNPSDSSRSVEHILPESLGNTEHVLPAGVVCDTCNNYFARKVEDPFLNSPAIRTLRACQGVTNKRGRLAGRDAILMGEHRATLYTPFNGIPVLDIPTDEGVEAIFRARSGTIILPAAHPSPPETVTSRFIAKAALESLALRGRDAGLSTDYLVEHVQLDSIRAHARRGEPKAWQYSQRRIYDANKAWLEHTTPHQRVHEHDFLVTDTCEYYFVVAIFGMELALNLGGPEIDGYVRWLAEHDNVSPLYFGKNSDVEGPLPAWR